MVDGWFCGKIRNWSFIPASPITIAACSRVHPTCAPSSSIDSTRQAHPGRLLLLFGQLMHLCISRKWVLSNLPSVPTVLKCSRCRCAFVLSKSCGQDRALRFSCSSEVSLFIGHISPLTPLVRNGRSGHLYSFELASGLVLCLPL